MKNPCDCGAESFQTKKDVGFDVWPGGEERQHLDICPCGKMRLWADVLDWEKGKWEDVYEDWSNKAFLGVLAGL